MVNARQFRQDLYYRINTLTLALPPLRHRKGDVQVLAARLQAHSLSRVGITSITAAEVLTQFGDAMQQHPWPGNVRELENLCDRIAVWLFQYRRSDSVEWSSLRDECPELFAGTPHIEEAPDASTATEHPPENPDRHTRALAALERHGGRTGAAAAELGVSRSTFWRWCRKPV